MKKNSFLIHCTLFCFIFSCCAETKVEKEVNAKRKLSTVLQHVKQAIGFQNMEKIKYKKLKILGIFNQNGIEGQYERWVDGKRYLFSVQGKLPMKIGFDGKRYWMTGQSDIPVYQSHYTHNKLLCTEWVERFRWLEDKQTNPFHVEIKNQIKDQNNVVLKVQQKEGPFHCEISIDPKHWYPISMKMSDRGMEMVSEYSDFREKDGFKIPYESKIIQPKTKQKFIIKIQKIQALKNINDSVFQLPKVDLSKDITVDNNRKNVLKVKKTFTGHFLLETFINDEGPFWFLLDSGAEGMVLSKQIAEDLKLEGFGKTGLMGVSGLTEGYFHRGLKLSLGNMHLHNQLWIIADISFLSMLGEKVSGVIGYELFARRVVELDMTMNRMTLYDPKNYKLVGTGWQEVQFDGKLPIFEGQFENQKGFFMLDSGAGEHLIFTPEAVKKFGLLNQRTTYAAMMGGVGDSGPMEARQGRMESFQIGEVELKKVKSIFIGKGSGPFETPYWTGIVGAALFADQAIIYNYPQSKIAFETRISRLEKEPIELIEHLTLSHSEKELRIEELSQIKKRKGFENFKKHLVNLCSNILLESSSPEVKLMAVDQIKAELDGNPKVDKVFDQILLEHLTSEQLARFRKSLQNHVVLDELQEFEFFQKIDQIFKTSFKKAFKKVR